MPQKISSRFLTSFMQMGCLRTIQNTYLIVQVWRTFHYNLMKVYWKLLIMDMQILIAPETYRPLPSTITGLRGPTVVTAIPEWSGLDGMFIYDDKYWHELWRDHMTWLYQKQGLKWRHSRVNKTVYIELPNLSTKK